MTYFAKGISYRSTFLSKYSEILESLYTFLSAAWEESTHIADEELEPYSNVSIAHIRADEIEANRIWGKGLVDLKQRNLPIRISLFSEIY